MEEELIFRLIFIGVFALGLSVSAYYRRLARKSGEVIVRRQEGTLALILRAVMTLPLLMAILLYAFIPEWMAWSAISLPVWVRWLGAGLGVACIPLIWWVFSSIGSNISETVLTKREHKLVTEGPYRWVRHPLYGVGLLEILALSLIASNWFMALLWIIGVLVFRFVVIPIE
jgi:protein-S-isoprenylcysteine O-methyltransferase Ste14